MDAGQIFFSHEWVQINIKINKSPEVNDELQYVALFFYVHEVSKYQKGKNKTRHVDNRDLY